MLHATRIGLSLDVFWSLTLRELSRESVAAAARERDDYNRDIALAWNTARLVLLGWSKGLPPLKREFLPDVTETKTPSQGIRSAMAVISKQFGFQSKPMSKESWDAIRRN